MAEDEIALLEGELAAHVERAWEADSGLGLALTLAAATAAACDWSVRSGLELAGLLADAEARFQALGPDELQAAAAAVAPGPLAERSFAEVQQRYLELCLFSDTDPDRLLRHFLWLMARLQLESGLSPEEAFARLFSRVLR